MGDPTGFLKNSRKVAGYRPVEQRINDYSEVELQLSEDERKLQASRCMDCGVPFCHWACPVSNIMPEWQDKVFKGEWKEAWEMLQETNNFPEFTGRVCPALCEASCVLALNDEAVTIRQNELAVIEKAFELGLVKANPPKKRSGKKVAVIGGGPAGLAAADQLNKAGHLVTLFEGTDRVGGYLRYGIPDFKLEKSFIDRRLDIMKEEGVTFKTNSYVGRDVKINDIMKEYDAVCITIGAREARDLSIEGRELSGIHQALDYLTQQNKTCAGDKVCQDTLIAALDKNVLVIGGGDTGSDCVGTANRQGARKVTQIELLPMPSKERTNSEPWPLWPRLHKTSSSHEEGCERLWCISSKKFIGENGKVKKVLACKVEWVNENGKFSMKEVPGSEFEIEADLVLLAMGFVHVVQKDFVNELGLKLDARGNIDTGSDYKTSADKVFAAGDANRGASLVVYAISEGRGAAEAINEFLSK
ncbi:MAG TPA: glutamate synthase subunit beta [Spirochaetota bacterium]|nr:glutamate synthase subunit beta [Spirochaetota bacterium]HQO22329.1 glutamate synthase subunit beta [Spirochaetota bacterium]HQQ22852.1 glutamate synthase subunit beta [Spirochaetota bacterium]